MGETWLLAYSIEGKMIGVANKKVLDASTAGTNDWALIFLCEVEFMFGIIISFIEDDNNVKFAYWYF